MELLFILGVLALFAFLASAAKGRQRPALGSGVIGSHLFLCECCGQTGHHTRDQTVFECRKCNGEGSYRRRLVSETIECPRCGGTGTVRITQYQAATSDSPPKPYVVKEVCEFEHDGIRCQQGTLTMTRLDDPPYCPY